MWVGISWAVEPGNKARLACYAGDGCDVECVIASVVWLCGGVMASEGASVASLILVVVELVELLEFSIFI